MNISMMGGLLSTGAVQPQAASEAASGTAPTQRSGGETQGRLPQPVTDEYVPEERREPSGLYWPGRDEEGRPKIYFDAPEERNNRSDTSAPAQGGEAVQPEEKGAGKKAETCVADTSKVDRELERLKRQRAELEQQLRTERDPARSEALEQQLAQVERELRQKDNDAYRRHHTALRRQ